MAVTSWREVVIEPHADRHIVQFYRDAGFLRDAVSAWLGFSLERGGSAILIGTPEHRRLVCDGLRTEGIDADAAEAAGRLLVIDARELLSNFMVEGMPDEKRFRLLACELASRALAAAT
ncbi:MAG: MEDS domain-containing protein, partial [Methanobacteriota archaeon]